MPIYRGINAVVYFMESSALLRIIEPERLEKEPLIFVLII